MLHRYQVWKRMRKMTGREIEKHAVFEFIMYFEQEIDMVIRQSARELEKKNELYDIQGLRPKERIDRECVRDAIKNIRNNGHGQSSERTGGIKEEAREKHSKKDTEVA